MRQPVGALARDVVSEEGGNEEWGRKKRRVCQVGQTQRSGAAREATASHAIRRPRQARRVARPARAA
ncbi:hypothetical protein L510_4719 [Bordetella bronchiseptica MBORD591]|nr:hypothetical protein L510_4719 [Bordetella bronchiseptica MBORD591]